MSKGDIVWSSESGDLRSKNKNKKATDEVVDENTLELHLRRLTTGKGRTVIEITNLPNNKNWCKKMAKSLKKALGVGGSYKDDKIEVHGEKMDQVIEYMTKIKISYKKIGG